MAKLSDYFRGTEGNHSPAGTYIWVKYAEDGETEDGRHTIAVDAEGTARVTVEFLNMYLEGIGFQFEGPVPTPV